MSNNSAYQTDTNLRFPQSSNNQMLSQKVQSQSQNTKENNFQSIQGEPYRGQDSSKQVPKGINIQNQNIKQDGQQFYKSGNVYQSQQAYTENEAFGRQSTQNQSFISQSSPVQSQRDLNQAEAQRMNSPSKFDGRKLLQFKLNQMLAQLQEIREQHKPEVAEKTQEQIKDKIKEIKQTFQKKNQDVKMKTENYQQLLHEAQEEIRMLEQESPNANFEITSYEIDSQLKELLKQHEIMERLTISQLDILLEKNQIQKQCSDLLNKKQQLQNKYKSSEEELLDLDIDIQLCQEEILQSYKEECEESNNILQMMKQIGQNITQSNQNEQEKLALLEQFRDLEQQIQGQMDIQLDLINQLDSKLRGEMDEQEMEESRLSENLKEQLKELMTQVSKEKNVVEKLNQDILGKVLKINESNQQLQLEKHENQILEQELKKARDHTRYLSFQFYQKMQNEQTIDKILTVEENPELTLTQTRVNTMKDSSNLMSQIDTNMNYETTDQSTHKHIADPSQLLEQIEEKEYLGEVEVSEEEEEVKELKELQDKPALIYLQQSQPQYSFPPEKECYLQDKDDIEIKQLYDQLFGMHKASIESKQHYFNQKIFLVYMVTLLILVNAFYHQFESFQPMKQMMFDVWRGISHSSCFH